MTFAAVLQTENCWRYKQAAAPVRLSIRTKLIYPWILITFLLPVVDWDAVPFLVINDKTALLIL